MSNEGRLSKILRGIGMLNEKASLLARKQGDVADSLDYGLCI